jgi:signal transduction histidine kinase
VAAHGVLRRFDTGDLMTAAGTPVGGLFILLTGHVAIFIDRGAGRHTVMDWQAGDVTGVLPYSRLQDSPGDSVAQESADILFIERGHLPALIRECHEVTSILVHTMLDRARVFTSSSLHDEKMVSLGKLSAGLAHELSNPVSAIERSASLLKTRLEEAELATRALGASRLTGPQLAAIDAVQASCLAKRPDGVLSPIQQAEREDAISDWLRAHGIGDAIAGPMAETAVTLEALDQIAEAVHGPALEAVLRWTSAGCLVRGIASEIQDASMRISSLVVAIKGFTHMDQATGHHHPRDAAARRPGIHRPRAGTRPPSGDARRCSGRPGPS